MSRWQREDKQLETLLQRWKEQERDETRPALLKRSLEGLRPEGRMLSISNTDFVHQELVK